MFCSSSCLCSSWILVFSEVRRGRWIPWAWSHRWLLLEAKLVPLQEYQVFLTSKPCLQAVCLLRGSLLPNNTSGFLDFMKVTNLLTHINQNIYWNILLTLLMAEHESEWCLLKFHIQVASRALGSPLVSVTQPKYVCWWSGVVLGSGYGRCSKDALKAWSSSVYQYLEVGVEVTGC